MERCGLVLPVSRKDFTLRQHKHCHVKCIVQGVVSHCHESRYSIEQYNTVPNYALRVMLGASFLDHTPHSQK